MEPKKLPYEVEGPYRRPKDVDDLVFWVVMIGAALLVIFL